MAHTQYDLVVIGGGPAGYAGAIRAGQLGKKVLCIEAERAGGTCLNWGCIPTKALLKTAQLLSDMNHASDFGIQTTKPTIDFAQVMKRSRTVADTMGKGIEFLFKKNKVDYVVGKAKIAVPGMVEITEGASKGQFFNTKNILIATGCTPKHLPDVPVDGERVMTSRELLARTTQPKSIIILGGGAIGVEFAYFMQTMGTQTTLIEMMPTLLPVEDMDACEAVERAFKKTGMQIFTSAKAQNIQTTAQGVSLDIIQGDKHQTLEAQALLVAVGVCANTQGLLSNKVMIEQDRGFIKVNERYESSVPGIYAAGDIIGPPWLAHVATFEAIQAVQGIFGFSKPKSVKLFPGCTYCQPQVASIGLTEAQAKMKGLDYQVGKFPFSASGKAVAMNHPEGFVKVITTKPHGEIVGAHIVGVDATELIAEYAVAMQVEATLEDIHGTIHPHPTLSEALAEAAAATHGEAIHI